jgi:hypothetical protein
MHAVSKGTHDEKKRRVPWRDPPLLLAGLCARLTRPSSSAYYLMILRAKRPPPTTSAPAPSAISEAPPVGGS